jgi:hypothetical protein
VVATPNSLQPLAVPITGVPSGGGNFALPHWLGYVPRNAVIQLTALGFLSFQEPAYDAENLYVTASGGTLTGRILIW